MSPRALAIGAGLVGAVALGVLGVALVRGQMLLIVVALAITALPLVVYLVAEHPRLVLRVGFTFIGIMPFATIPGTALYIAYPIALLLLVIAAMHRGERGRARPVIPAMVCTYLLVSLASAIATWIGVASVDEYVRWALMTSAALAVVAMRDDLRLAVAGALSVGVAIGGLVAMAQMVADPQGRLLSAFQFIGYARTNADITRTALVEGTEAVRATGFYVDPNTAGLFFVFALGLAGFALRGRMRVAVVGVLLLATVASLSRSAIITVIVAMLLIVVLRRQDASSRAGLVGAGVVALVVSFAVPVVRERLLDSFDSNDVGARARVAAYEDFPMHMEGSWWWGRGWSLREFVDPAYAYSLNHVANTPLLVVYRGGILDGIVFVALLLAIVLLAARFLWQGLPDLTLLSATLIALVLVAFQLDFPVVTVQPLALGFAIMIGCIASADRSGVEPAGVAVPRMVLA